MSFTAAGLCNLYNKKEGMINVFVVLLIYHSTFCRKEVKDPDVLYNMLKNLLAQIKVRLSPVHPRCRHSLTGVTHLDFVTSDSS